jgi:hypothetical protein
MPILITALWVAVAMLPVGFSLAICILLCRSAWVRFTPFAGPTYGDQSAATARKAKALRKGRR